MMSSPFSDLVRAKRTSLGATHHSVEARVQTPLIDPSILPIGVVMEQYDGEIVENQVAPNVTSAKIGDFTFVIADGGKAFGDEFREPIFSGNPLVIVTAAARKIHISKNFVVGEFAQAQSGRYKFNFVRIDPVLVSNLQRLRTFVGKSMEIVDGYYSPKYLKVILGVKDTFKLMLNPHVTGRAVKVSIPAFNGIIKQIAIASFVACDKDVSVGIGTSTMVLAVKQPATKKPDVPDYDPLVKSYIKDEKIKVSIINFCVDVKRILHEHNSAYASPMRKAVSAYAARALQVVYRVDALDAEQLDWETPLRTVISLMHMSSMTKDPNVILYSLAYSDFGNLYRVFLKDKQGVKTTQSIVDNLLYPSDNQNRNTPGSFLFKQREDKPGFIKYCISRILVGKKMDGTAIHLVPPDFFDWKNNRDDKTFLDTISRIINDEYLRNRYDKQPAPQRGPEGGTLTHLNLTPANPDKPLNDFTGRYWSPAPADAKDFHGRYFLVNQAGKYVSGKYGVVYAGAIKKLKNTLYEFFGTVDDKGNAICTIYPQQTLILKKANGQVRAYLLDNTTDTVKLSLELTVTSRRAVLSKLIVNSFVDKAGLNEELLLILAWIRPPASMLEQHLKWFNSKDKEVRNAITSYYNEGETQPSVKRNKLRTCLSNLDSAISRYGKLPAMFTQFTVYYTRYVYSVTPHWTPRSDRETRSTSDWIKRMLEDYRHLAPSEVSEFKDLYDYFGISLQIPPIEYWYKAKISVTSFGVGPFARSSGTIEVENKTDYAKYPKAEKWNSDTLYITLWNATLSLNLFKLAPKISVGDNFEGDVKTSTFYSPSDFSGADVQITEGKLFEIPISLGSSNDVSASTKISKGAYIILIEGQGKKELEFGGEQKLGLPDTIEFEPDVKTEEGGLYEKIAKMLPSLTMHKGTISRKRTSVDIQSIPLPDKFSSVYRIEDRKYFKHDNAELSIQAIEAVGRMCAEELVALSDPQSEIEVYGHTDASGTPEHNLKLSKARAQNTWQAIKDRFDNKVNAKLKKIEGLGEVEANKKYGEYTVKNPWLRTVVVVINGRAVLSLGET